MRISTRARYALRALLDLELHQDNGSVTLKEIARRQEVSLQYLEHLFRPLVTAGIIRSVRGPKGGVFLARPAGEIKIGEIVRLLDGSVAPVECVDNPGICPRAESCATRDIWSDLKAAVDGVLNATTLQDLSARQKQKEQQLSQTTHYS
jgi:Rrf2 family protein